MFPSSLQDTFAEGYAHMGPAAYTPLILVACAVASLLCLIAKRYWMGQMLLGVAFYFAVVYLLAETYCRGSALGIYRDDWIVGFGGISNLPGEYIKTRFDTHGIRLALFALAHVWIAWELWAERKKRHGH